MFNSKFLYFFLSIFFVSFFLPSQTFSAVTANSLGFSSDGTLSATSTGTFNFNSSVADSDVFSLTPSTGGLASFFGVFTSSDLTASRTWTFPNVSGTIITTGDTDSVTNTMLGGSITEGKFLFADNTTGNSTTTAHGFLPKLGGGTTNYLRADGTWATPPGGTGATLDVANTFTALNKFTNGLEAYQNNNASNAEGVSIGNSAGDQDVSDSINIGFATGGAASGDQNVRIGRHAGYASVGGQAVTIGHAASQYAYSNNSSVVIGYLAGRNALMNSPNYTFSSVIIGNGAVQNGKNNQSAVVIGSNAGADTLNTVNATILGAYAGAASANSDESVLVGNNAGRYGNNYFSVLIGAGAGRDLDRAESLVIEADSSYAYAGNTGLIYGEFDTRKLVVNGGFFIGTQPAKPTCNSSNRAGHWFVRGGAGVADTYEVCMKDSFDVYAWKVVATP